MYWIGNVFQLPLANIHKYRRGLLPETCRQRSAETQIRANADRGIPDGDRRGITRESKSPSALSVGLPSISDEFGIHTRPTI